MFLSGEIIRRFLIVIYGVFIGLGLGMVIYGIYLAATTKVDLENINSLEVNSVTAIFAGLLDIAIGLVGVLGVLQNRRILLIILVGVLSAIILTNVFIVVVTIIASNSVSISRDNIRNQIVSLYGNNTDKLAKEFTLGIDNHHKEEQCCGFSGDESENLFVKTPWYKNVNVHVDKKRNLPDSCCVEAGAKCREAEDLKEAREKKYVHEHDCLAKMSNSVTLHKWLTIFQMLFASIIQGVCIAATVMRIMNPSDSE